jgi:elongation factor P
MDNETFEQFSLPTDSVAEKIRFLKEGDVCGMLYWNGQVIDMTPPQQVILEVTYTEPAAKGNTATNVTKSATVETGAEVQVPAFISQGERIKIDVATGAYIERANR